MYGAAHQQVALTAQDLYIWHIRHVVFQSHVTHTAREAVDRQYQIHSRETLYVTVDM